jgi:DNA-binding NarL/FixJ family response regulator
MKILVIDDDRDFRELARVFLKRSFPLATVSDYDPEIMGLPAVDFPWADYDVALLDYELNTEQNGLDWLRQYSGLPGFPAVIFSTSAGDEYLAVRAIKSGADEYLNKRDLSAVHLGNLVSSVLAKRETDVVDHTTRERPESGKASSTGRQISGYNLRRLLGCGSTADVYLAQSDSDDITVVIKLLREGFCEEPQAVSRFLAEADILHHLDCPEVVRIHDHGVRSGQAFVAMEYFGHGDLRHRISQGISVRQALNYIKAIARSLSAIHKRGVVHRDLKPGNIMFRYDDSLGLLDFGMSKRLDQDLNLTATGTILGTPAYMSPEQCDGLEIDGRSDLYSAGVILYEMLTHQRPFTGNTAARLFMQHSAAPIPRLPAHVAIFQDVVEGLMAKSPEDRFQTGAGLLEALNGVGSLI